MSRFYLLQPDCPANMAWRWEGTVLLEVEKRFHRVKGYRKLPLLIEKLQEVFDCEEAVA